MTKLGNIPSLFFKIIKFLHDLQSEKTFVTDIFNKVYREKSLKQLRNLKKILIEIRNSKKETLNDYLEKIFELYNRNEDLDYKKIVKNVFQIEDISLENIKKYRILTEVECEMIQMFPPNWTNTMPSRRRYFMMGNALVTGIISRLEPTLRNIIENE